MLVSVPGVQKTLDRVLEVRDAPEDTAADRLAVDEREPGFHLVEPARAGGREMEVEAAVAGEPRLVVGVGPAGREAPAEVWRVWGRRRALRPSSRRSCAYQAAVGPGESPRNTMQD